MFIKINVYQFIESRDTHKNCRRPPVWEPLVYTYMCTPTHAYIQCTSYTHTYTYPHTHTHKHTHIHIHPHTYVHTEYPEDPR